MNWIIENWQGLLAVLGGLVSVSTLIVAITPSQKDDAILAKVIKVANWLSVINPKGLK